jgi:hypothetical protein
VVTKSANPAAKKAPIPKVRKPPRIILLAGAGAPPMEDQLRDPVMTKRLAAELESWCHNWLIGTHRVAIDYEIKAPKKGS